MTVPLFDVQTGFGGLPTGKAESVALDELLDEMAHLSIDRSLVRIVPDEQERDVPADNAALFDACDAHDALVPCPVVVPNTAYDLAPEEDQVAEAVAHGAGAASVRPGKDGWLLRDWACGRLLRALEERRLPVFCLERDFTLEQVGDLAAKYPELPIILAGLAYRSQRMILPLMETFRNVHAAMGFRFAVHAGIEQLVQRVGVDRVLFGTGFPESEAGMAVTQLMYADLSDEDKVKIGSGNFERLMEAIAR